MASGTERDKTFLIIILTEVNRIWENEGILSQRIDRGISVTAQIKVMNAALERVRQQLHAYRPSANISDKLMIILNQTYAIKHRLEEIPGLLAAHKNVSVDLRTIRNSLNVIETELNALARQIGFEIGRTPERGSFLQRITHF